MCREATSSALFFKHNSALGPPYNVIVDTNFINFSIKNKMDLVKGMMDCLYAQCVPHITDCVMAELEKLGQKYRVALRVAKVRRVPTCLHSNTFLFLVVFSPSCFFFKGWRSGINRIKGV